MIYHYVRSNSARTQQPESEFSEEEIKSQIFQITNQIVDYERAIPEAKENHVFRAHEKRLCTEPFLKANQTKILDKCQYCLAASFEANINMHPCHNETLRNLKFDYSEINIEYRILELVVLKDYWQEILEERKTK